VGVGVNKERDFAFCLFAVGFIFMVCSWGVLA